MESKRSKRVGELIKHEIAEILLNEIRDPRIGFVTLQIVKVSRDLRNARVFFSVIGGDIEKESALEGLTSASNYIRKALYKKLSLKYIPGLIFQLDDSVEHSIRINHILEELREDF